MLIEASNIACSYSHGEQAGVFALAYTVGPIAGVGHPFHTQKLDVGAAFPQLGHHEVIGHQPGYGQPGEGEYIWVFKPSGLGFLYQKDLIGVDIPQSLLPATGPEDSDFLHPVSLA